MSLGVRVAALGAAALVTSCVLTSCDGSPAVEQKKAVGNILTTTTSTTPPTTSTSSTSSTTTDPGVTVPNVIGMKIAAAHAALHAAGLWPVSLIASCDKGTLASQSVVASLATPGKSPDVRVGAMPLNPGADVPPGTRVGITWSGCYGDASDVPAVVGLTLAAARHALHAAGLTWACYSVGKPATTTTAKAPVTTTTVEVVRTVLTQSPAAHMVLPPGTIVRLTMHHCPQ